VLQIKLASDEIKCLEEPYRPKPYILHSRAASTAKVKVEPRNHQP